MPPARTLLAVLAAAGFAALAWKELPAATRYLKMRRM
jgi:hypothetical protein